jgi:amino acid permease
VILCLFALLAWYTGVLLHRCLDSKEGLEAYPDIGHAAFGTTGRIVISVQCCSNYDNLFNFDLVLHISVLCEM